MKCSDLVRVLRQQADESYAYEWDNVGLLVGSFQKEIKRVYIALDATDEVIQAAIAAKADMLLTHHPLIFRGMKRITEEDVIGRRVIAMIQAQMCYYAMHTNFDVMGMADLAAEKLKLSECVPLEVTCVEEGRSQGLGRVGCLKQSVSLAECCEQVKQAFDLKHVKVFGTLTEMVQRVAICPGAGKSTLAHALRAGADVYITGDIDHHTGIDAVAEGMSIIDAGHYGIEHIFVPYMEKYLQQQVPELEIVVQGSAQPFQIV